MPRQLPSRKVAVWAPSVSSHPCQGHRGRAAIVVGNLAHAPTGCEIQGNARLESGYQMRSWTRERLFTRPDNPRPEAYYSWKLGEGVPSRLFRQIGVMNQKSAPP